MANQANHGTIQADGGQVVLDARALKDSAARAVVNNTGLIEARTIDNSSGTIKLLGDLHSGVVNQAGTLDASAPNGGDGGFVETSAFKVETPDSARVSTAAPQGRAGTWPIRPHQLHHRRQRRHLRLRRWEILKAAMW